MSSSENPLPPELVGLSCSLYAYLGVEDEGVELREIRRAYRRKALIYHPDKRRQPVPTKSSSLDEEEEVTATAAVFETNSVGESLLDEDAEEKFRTLQLVYEYLSNETSRAKYDAYLANKRQSDLYQLKRDAEKRKLAQRLSANEIAASNNLRQQFDQQNQIKRLRAQNQNLVKQLNQQQLLLRLKHQTAASTSTAQQQQFNFTTTNSTSHLPPSNAVVHFFPKHLPLHEHTPNKYSNEQNFIHHNNDEPNSSDSQKQHLLQSIHDALRSFKLKNFTSSELPLSLHLPVASVEFHSRESAIRATLHCKQLKSKLPVIPKLAQHNTSSSFYHTIDRSSQQNRSDLSTMSVEDYEAETLQKLQKLAERQLNEKQRNVLHHSDGDSFDSSVVD